jgi:hypothetical protein
LVSITTSSAQVQSYINQQDRVYLATTILAVANAPTSGGLKLASKP